MKYLLVLVVVVVGIWMLASRFRKPPDPGQGRSTGPATGGSPQATSAEDGGAVKAVPGQIVACCRCGVHLPAETALPQGFRACLERGGCGSIHCG